MIKTLALMSVLLAVTSAFQMHPIVLADGWTDLEGDDKVKYEGNSYSALVTDFGINVGEEFVVEGWKALRYKQDATGTYVVYQLGGSLSEPVEVLFLEPEGGTRTVSYVKDPAGEWCFGCDQFAQKIALGSVAVLIMTAIINF